jgi:hypothetical protein
MVRLFHGIDCTHDKTITDGMRVVYLPRGEDNKGDVLWQPTTVVSNPNGPALHLLVLGNCTTRPGGLGSNVAKMTKSTHDAAIAVALGAECVVWSAVADLATAYADEVASHVPPTYLTLILPCSQELRP